MLIFCSSGAHALVFFFFEEWHQESQAVQGELNRRVVQESPISQQG
jgi:hypothetical protein